MKITVTEPMLVGGVHRAVGDTLDLPEKKAKYLSAIGKARMIESKAPAGERETATDKRAAGRETR